MSSSSASAASHRGMSDAAVANERIRALVDSADGTWPAEAYEVLLREWAAAVGADVDSAA
jgi:hypothetical protein